MIPKKILKKGQIPYLITHYINDNNWFLLKEINLFIPKIKKKFSIDTLQRINNIYFFSLLKKLL